MSEPIEDWKQALRTMRALDQTTPFSAYQFTAAVMLYCTTQIVRAIQEAKP